MVLMPKTHPLHTDAKSNLRDRVLGEVENSFIALSGKGDTVGFVPIQEDLVRIFIAIVQGLGCR